MRTLWNNIDRACVDNSAMVRLIALTAALVQVGAVNLAAPSKSVPYLSVPHGASVILRTPSTNTSGYRIVVGTNGSAEFVAGQTRATASVPQELGAKYFRDLAAAQPLQQLPVQGCMKSASFGTSLYVYWNHQRSGDLSCAGDAAGRAVAADTDAIAAALHIGTLRPIMRPMMPGEFHHPLPTPT